ncbi:MAG: DNA-binding protein [Gammaproteobacteria bacterium]
MATAAEWLQGEGKNPTADRVREVLGTGSKSTVLTYLQQWRSRPLNIPEELLHTLPPELLAFVAGLWKQVNETTDARLQAHLQESQKKIETVKEAFAELQGEHETLRSQCKQESDKNQFLHLEKTSVEAEYHHEQQEHAKLRENYKTLQAQLIEAREEKNRFHDLANKLQDNLKHYHESVQARQLEHDLKFEALRAERDTAYEEVRKHCVQIHTLEADISQKDRDLQAYATLNTQLENAQKALMAVTRKNDILTERYDQLEKSFEEQKGASETANRQHSAVEKERILLTGHVEHITQNLREAHAKIQLLESEKMAFIQENSKLQSLVKVTVAEG